MERVCNLMQKYRNSDLVNGSGNPVDLVGFLLD